MTNEQINVAIAEELGREYHKPTPEEKASGSYYQYEPDFCNNLNAMHEAEKMLEDDEQCPTGKWVYEQALKRVCKLTSPIFATARQRAEAFLRCLGKWKD